jgi:hypothetical protein
MPQETITAAEYRKRMGQDRPTEKRRQSRREEDQIQRETVKLLRLLGSRLDAVWFAVPNGGARSKIEAAIFQGLGVVAGVPDLVFLWRDGCGGIELKREGGRLSESQREFRARCREKGIRYEVARSPAEVLEVLGEWGRIS